MKNTLLFLALSFTTFSQTYNLQSGINYYGEEKYDEALAFLKKEIAQNPKEGKAYYYLALINVEKETYAQGLTQVNLAITHLTPTDTLVAYAWKLKGDIYFHLDDLEKFDTDNIRMIDADELNAKKIQYAYNIKYY